MPLLALALSPLRPRPALLRPGACRALHLQASEAATFLARRLPAAEVSAAPPPPSSNALALLLHADRRPQSLPDGRSTQGIRAHYGPSLLGCHQALLPTDRASLGPGDLGVLLAQRDKPAGVVQLPISLQRGLALDHAFGFLLRMSPIAGLSLPEPLTWRAAEALQQLWDVFKACEGVWFTAHLLLEGGKVRV